MEKQVIEVAKVTDKLQLAVLDAIAQMTKPTYAIDIMVACVASTRESLNLETVFSAIIDLILDNRVKKQYTDPDDTRSRCVYTLVIPEGMTLYGPSHPNYPNKPDDWDKNNVLHIGGDYCATHGDKVPAAWIYNGYRDGTDVLAYFSESVKSVCKCACHTEIGIVHIFPCCNL